MYILLMKRDDRSLFSWVISLVTRSIYTHSAIIYDGFVHESTETAGKVQATRVSEYQYAHRQVDIYSINLDDKKLEAYIQVYKDTKYDWAGIFGWLFHAQQRSKFYCFEYVWEAIKHASPDGTMLDMKDLDRLSGDDIKNLVPRPYIFTGIFRNFAAAQEDKTSS